MPTGGDSGRLFTPTSSLATQGGDDPPYAAPRRTKAIRESVCFAASGRRILDCGS